MEDADGCLAVSKTGADLSGNRRFESVSLQPSSGESGSAGVFSSRSLAVGPIIMLVTRCQAELRAREVNAYTTHSGTRCYGLSSGRL